MLKRLATTIAIAFALATPARAYQVDVQHQYLISQLEEQGVQFYVNPNDVCHPDSLKANEMPESLNGLYFFNPQYQTPVIVICQDNRTNEDEVEAEWSANDLDTLRHEATHFIQDCIFEVDGEMHPFHDGDGPAPGVDNYAQVIEMLGHERAMQITNLYIQNMNANGRVIRLEHEAFAVAEHVDAGSIGATIRDFCK